MYRRDLLHRINIYNRQIRRVANGLADRAVWHRQDEKNITIYLEGRGLYVEDTGFHDVFRRYEYPNHRLFSLEETLQYINNPENQCQIDDRTEERLREFWSKYPDGMIQFG